MTQESNLFFWAQSLDNESPDFILENGKMLDDPECRKQLVSKIYNVSGEKKRLSDNPDVAVRYGKNEFVIEVIPNERDEAGRLAPVLIYGQFRGRDTNKENWGKWVNQVCEEINKVFFGNEDNNLSDRKFNESSISTIRKWLSQKIYERDNKVAGALVAIGVFVVVVRGALAAISNQEKNPQETETPEEPSQAIENVSEEKFEDLQENANVKELNLEGDDNLSVSEVKIENGLKEEER